MSIVVRNTCFAAVEELKMIGCERGMGVIMGKNKKK